MTTKRTTAKPLRRSFLRLLIASVAVLALVALAGFVLLTRPLTLRDDGFVYVPRKSSVASAIDSIEAHAHMSSPWLADLAARVIARVGKRPIQAGWYRLDSSARTIDAVLMLFSTAQRPSVRVTLPEGITYTEMASILARVAEVDSTQFVAWCTSDSIVRSAGVAGNTMEGYLMPDTYDVHWREEADVVGQMLHTTFRRRWERDVRPLLTSASRSQHDVLTLASIVQAEAVAADEMDRIAGVYENRLRIGMKLEADPTVQYGRGQRTRVLYDHLGSDSPYNTYRHAGLPPGPINNPGVAALRAAIQPETHAYLYFVAEGDGSGRHRFAASGAEHLRNVAVYRRRRAQR